MKKITLLCIDLIARLQNGPLQSGEPRQGTLVMTEDQERVEFDEAQADAYTRNPKVWRGKYFNVHRDKAGTYQVHFKRMVLGSQLNPAYAARGIKQELITAKKVLGL